MIWNLDYFNLSKNTWKKKNTTAKCDQVFQFWKFRYWKVWLNFFDASVCVYPMLDVQIRNSLEHKHHSRINETVL